MQKESRFANIVLAAVPLLIAPVLFIALAEGWLDFSGGEKDILIVFPYALWALIFFVVSLILIIRGWPLRRWAGRAALLSVGTVLILWIIAFSASWFRVA